MYILGLITRLLIGAIFIFVGHVLLGDIWRGAGGLAFAFPLIAITYIGSAFGLYLGSLEDTTNLNSFDDRLIEILQDALRDVSIIIFGFLILYGLVFAFYAYAYWNESILHLLLYYGALSFICFFAAFSIWWVPNKALFKYSK